MRKVLIGGLLALGLLTPAFAEEPEVVYQEEMPEGYPWVMGDGTVTLDGMARSYTTYDFSVGAFDASVQFRKYYDCSGKGACDDTGKIELAIGAYPDANPDAKGDVVRIHGLFPRVPGAPRKAREVEIEVRDVGGQPGHWLRSKGPAKLQLTAIKRGDAEGSDSYGTLSATVTGTVCDATEEAMVPGGACHSFKAVFTTKVQYDSV